MPTHVPEVRVEHSRAIGEMSRNQLQPKRRKDTTVSPMPGNKQTTQKHISSNF
ncbi:hypothetical protein DPMN_015016 [Dreissena polymorpha]|uniref:Uncharacterized protein n=1 Tax=Dreissena polymorpha TaxID=45954 RepID=A0A9D4S5S9_DREPO|nr:hypothetical protein DPMN_015016 [Dreissena polymorpha]